MLAMLLTTISLDAAATSATLHDLQTLSLEELGGVSVTSVSKHGERLIDAPASIYVITHDDIRRSAATNLPEVLRLAPNLQVAQVSASGYTVSARGFNNSAANKLLVLIDGRSVYSPLFAGVFWDVQELMLEDIDRIEIISGPAGTLWGVNAVNGVINIITRSAQATQDGLVTGETGNRGRDGAVRYGGVLDNGAAYRLYAKYVERDPTTTANGVGKDDAWHRTQAGFRSDWNDAGDSVTLLGDVYSGDEGQPLPGTIAISGVSLPLATISLAGANLNGHWSRQLDGDASLAVQAYYDRTQRTVPPTFAETLDTVDLQLQHSMPIGTRQHWTWGAEYRGSWDHVRNSVYVAFLPADIRQSWSSLFGQIEVNLQDDLQATFGARLEHNDYTGMEFLPSIRLAKKLSPERLLWAAVSRTVRAPSRLDHDTFVPGSPPFLLDGGEAVRSEVANVYELGYRAQSSASFSYSITAYRADYDHLRTQEVAPSGTFLYFANGAEGSTTGVELWGTWQAIDKWRLSGGWTGLHQDRRSKPGSNDTGALQMQDLDPAHSWQVRSSWDLPGAHELDITVRRVAALLNPVARCGPATPCRTSVPAYTATDIRYGWKLQRGWTLALIGQNLFGSAHAEFADPLTRSELGPAVYLRGQARF